MSPSPRRRRGRAAVPPRLAEAEPPALNRLTRELHGVGEQPERSLRPGSGNSLLGVCVLGVPAAAQPTAQTPVTWLSIRYLHIWNSVTGRGATAAKAALRDLREIGCLSGAVYYFLLN